jgi:hypothetical protein
MTGIGSSMMAAHMAGKDLSPGQAIKAKCADCMGNYADGRISCETPECPLWPFMPYNPNKKRRYNPSRVGMKPGEKNRSEICDDSEEGEA